MSTGDIIFVALLFGVTIATNASVNHQMIETMKKEEKGYEFKNEELKQTILEMEQYIKYARCNQGGTKI